MCVMGKGGFLITGILDGLYVGVFAENKLGTITCSTIAIYGMMKVSLISLYTTDSQWGIYTRWISLGKHDRPTCNIDLWVNGVIA